MAEKETKYILDDEDDRFAMVRTMVIKLIPIVTSEHPLICYNGLASIIAGAAIWCDIEKEDFLKHMAQEWEDMNFLRKEKDSNE